ncbi:MAG: glycoside-pentoside-hexuronide (GPH):cation symporter [Clostridiales bacterium]|nr:glycoside-pentoside-hexuronide (GPH):cation symporter [Clostridiales bacterium]
MAETTHSTLESASVELKNKERFNYAAGVIGMMVPFTLPLGFLTFFWTDVAMIPIGIVGTVLMVGKLWDAINDPIIGGIADRTTTKRGRYRPWMIPSGIISNLTCLLVFLRIPALSETGQIVYYFAAYFIFVAAFTALEIPHISMMSTITTDYTQRGLLASWRQTSAQVVMTVMNATFIPMTIYLVPNDRAAGYFWAVLIYITISTPFYFICYFGSKERVIPPVNEVKVPFSESYKALKGNKPVIMLMAAHLCHGLNAATGIASGMYFWTYVAGDIIYSAVNATFMSFGSIIAAVLMGVLVKKYSNKRNIAMISWFVSAFIAIFMFWIPVDTSSGRMLFNIISFVRGLVNNVGFVCLFSMVPDVTEYTMAKYNLRASGFIFACINFMFKFGISFGQGVMGWIMSAMGYVPGASQPQSLIVLWRSCMSFIPAIITCLGALCFMGYTLTKESHEELLRTLDA